MDYSIEFDQEDDGRWKAEIPLLSGVMVHGATKKEAESKGQALALRIVKQTGLKPGLQALCSFRELICI